MAITYVGAGAHAEGIGTHVPGLPTGWQPGDIFIAVVGYSTSWTRNCPTGWTEFIYKNNGGNSVLKCFWKKAETGDTDPSITASGTGDGVSTIFGFRGVDATNPIATSQTGQGYLANNPATLSGITPGVDGAEILFCLTYGDNSTLSGWSLANGPTLTEVQDEYTTGGSDSTTGVAIGLQATNAATGTASVSLKNDAVWAAALIALRPHTFQGNPAQVNATAGSSATALTSAATIPQIDAAAQASATTATPAEGHTTPGAAGSTAAVNLVDGLNIAAQAQASTLVAIGGVPLIGAYAKGAAASQFSQETKAPAQATAQATAAVTLQEVIQVSAIAQGNPALYLSQEALAIIAAAAQAGASTTTTSGLVVSAIAASLLTAQTTARFTPGDFRTEALRISRSINDAHWVAELQIDKTQTPGWWDPIEAELQDHTGTEQMVFIGLVPGSEYNLRAAANKARSVGYSQTWYLDQQFLTPAQLNMGLADDAGWNDWDDVIDDLLGGSSWDTETGIEPYRLRNPGTDYETKRFSFQPGTTKMQAITEIAKFCGFIFHVKPRWTGTEWRSSAYFVNIDEIDDPDTGLDLPSPVTFSAPDPYVVEIPSVDDLGKDRYNRVIVRGHDSSGNWYTGTVESPNVTAGIAHPREYYEESAAHNTQAKCDARAQELYALYNLVCKTARLTLKDRTDLQLLQQIELDGYDGCLDISETYYRIIEITYDQRPEGTQVHVTATPDRLKASTWYADQASGDLISETEIIAAETVRQIPVGDPGTVTAIDGDIITVALERGGTVEARKVGTDPEVGDAVFIQPQIDGAYVVAGGGGMKADLAEDLNLNSFKLYIYKGATDAESIYLAYNSSTGNLIIHLPTGKEIEWSMG